MGGECGDHERHAEKNEPFHDGSTSRGAYSTPFALDV
jgi:hypothetical protein